MSFSNFVRNIALASWLFKSGLGRHSFKIKQRIICYILIFLYLCIEKQRPRSSVGLEQRPSKAWVLGSNPNEVTECSQRNHDDSKRVTSWFLRINKEIREESSLLRVKDSLFRWISVYLQSQTDWSVGYLRGRLHVQLVAKVRRFEQKPNITEHTRTQMSYILSYTLPKVSYTCQTRFGKCLTRAMIYSLSVKKDSFCDIFLISLRKN